MKVIFSSQFRDSSGYASAARSYLEAIDSVIDQYDIDFKILSIAVESKESSKISQRLEDLIQKYEINISEIDSYIKDDYLLIWHQPTGMLLFGDGHLSQDIKWQSFKKLLVNATKNVNMTVWESNKIPQIWSSLHKEYKTTSTIVPCGWNQKTFCQEGLKSYLLPHVISDNIVDPHPIDNFPIDLSKTFTVFSMSQWIHRKGFDALIKAFSMEFNNVDDAILVIKTYVSAMGLKDFDMSKQSKHVRDSIVQIKNGIFMDGRISNAKIIPICSILPYENISWLYQQSDIFALATRGEGFGLTISEAIMHEKPLVVPDYGGHMDYVSKENSFLFKGYEHPYVGDPTYNYDMTWYEPDVMDLRKKLREAYNLWKSDPSTLSEMGKKSKNTIEGYDLQSIGHEFFKIVNKEAQSNSEDVKERVKSYSSDSRKINLLKDSYKDEDCYIITCGPSLKEYSPEFLKEKLKGKLVFAIKQAYNHIPELVDFHFFNSNNFQLYEYGDNRPVVITNAAESELAMIHHVWSNKQKYDIFTFIPDDKDFSKSICKSLDFDKYLFDNTLERPWGPGMMTEVVVYMALHLGVKNIYTIGWDLEKPGTTTSHHFYEDRELVRRADPMKEEEIKLNIETTKHLNEWLLSRGVNLFVANENSYVHSSVPRRLLK
jgi:glycosyltransferase involved in cell wall biosynthesis